MTEVLSPARDFTGWAFAEWFKGNWRTIKELAKVGAPFAVAWLTTNNPLLLGFFTIFGKFLLDTGEYYFKVITK